MGLGLRNPALFIVPVIPYVLPASSLRLSVINLLMISSFFYSEVDFESPLPEHSYLSMGPRNLSETGRVRAPASPSIFQGRYISYTLKHSPEWPPLLLLASFQPFCPPLAEEVMEY